MAELRWVLAGLLMVAAALPAAAQEEPPLPEGLTGQQAPPEEPMLPSGLAPASQEAEPSLPPGLAQPPAATREAPARKAGPLDWLNLAGFWEVRGGVRTQHDPHERQASLGETRLQLESENRWQGVAFRLTADLLYDAVATHHTPRLDRGEGFLDLREASAAFSPAKLVDVRIGRQILTWGTGDLIFINDLFPKDYVSFFIGRDVEYLKAPSDAVRVSLYSELVNVDAVYAPVFDADRFITGRRASFWNDLLGRRSGRDAVVHADRPNEWFDDAEYALRIFRNLRGYELAGYGYWGYWKSPAGVDRRDFEATFPRLSVYGASARGAVGGGVVNFEAGYYDSRQDRSGEDPFVRNSELRLLAGYERDLPRIAKDFTVAAQYYLERMMHHDAYLRALPPGTKATDQCRHVLTVRLTKLLMRQNLKLSLFAFYSPSDSDAYLRPHVQYKIDDHWTAEIGGNVFFGARPFTFFAQFTNDTNLYAALRYGF